MAMTAQNLVVHGRVQGVGFRYFVQRAAQRLGLGGWVRNLSDGTVEIEVEGDEAAVADLLREVRTGPPFSRVDRVDADPRTPTGKPRRFTIEG
jgi:acylphosphatase